MRRRVGLMVALAACGRINFGPLGGAGEAGDAGGPDGDIATLANRIFVTRQRFDANLGGLAGADMKCNDAAAAAGLQGTFVAWLSDSTTNAIDRFGGSRGWVRPDGVPVFDTIAEAFSARNMFNPILVDEQGTPVTAFSTRTGTNAAGTRNAELCSDWTSNSSTTSSGIAGLSNEGMSGFTLGNLGYFCAASFSIYCLEVGRVQPVGARPHPGGGRLAFVSTTPRTTAGIPALDSICQTDATGAGLTGMFRAAVATTTTTIASRFVVDQRPIVRVDGTLVATTAASLFAGDLPVSFVNQTLNGGYVSGSFWTGASGPNVVGSMGNTCNSWADLTATTGLAGTPTSADATRFWGARNINCNVALPVLCIED